MKRTIYQLLFIVSVIFFLFSSFFTVAFAENIDGGTCGENLTWELDDSNHGIHIEIRFHLLLLMMEFLQLATLLFITARI